MQERQRVRERMPDREQRVQDYEWDEARAKDRDWRRKYLEERPRVVKYDSVPWEQSQSACHKVFTAANRDIVARKAWTAPTNIFRVLLQSVEAGHKTANHRHYAEVPFFILEGTGHEVHDGHRFDWGPGDLMIVPPYCWHQHFCDEGPATILYIQSDLNGPNGRELSELNENYVLPPDARPLYDQRGELVGYRKADGEEILFSYDPGKTAMARRMEESPPAPSHAVTDGYDYYLRLYEEERHWRQTVPQVIKQSDRAWEDTRNGRVLWFLHPQHPALQTGLRMCESYVQELPPGGKSGKHLHVGEEVHFIIEGRGYDVIDDQRWDWETNDVVAIPEHATHQSFNADPAHPARFIAFKSRLYEYLSFGGIEHLEDAAG